MKLTITSPAALRDDAIQAIIQPEENRVGKTSGHLFKPGDKAVLNGLQSFPEYNGQEVEITNIREDGELGRAYYIKGRINRHLNWVYEYRLKSA